ncbi:MAG: ferrous iron transport protein A [Caldimicrobium sp.]|nr:ferrous iron transport protein A [Caldimicrobium sp.]
MVPLGLLSEKERGEVVEIRGFEEPLVFMELSNNKTCEGGCLFCRRKNKELERIKELGLRPGVIVEIRKNDPWQPLLVAFENTLLVINRQLAMKIMVKKL